jgi:prolyl-tRNA editing enzyme YbaK/EbsC (Cys-tRNA(Pro) deacylase)
VAGGAHLVDLEQNCIAIAVESDFADVLRVARGITLDPILLRPAVERVRSALSSGASPGEIKLLESTARSSKEAADSLGIEVGQIAASIIFRLPNDSPVLVITRGRQRVDTDLITKHLGVAELLRADADYIKNISGFTIGGVSPVGWITSPLSIIDVALNDYDVVWAAAGHPHAVYPTTFEELQRMTGSTPLVVGE